MPDKMSDLEKKFKKVLMNLKDLSDFGGQISKSKSRKFISFSLQENLIFLSIRNAFLAVHLIQVHYRS